jgi:hypothetical protein
MEVDLIDGTSDREAVVAAFAEQFAVDVTGLGENQRARLLSTLGDNVSCCRRDLHRRLRAEGVGGIRGPADR